MIFAPAHGSLETIERDTRTKAQACTMAARLAVRTCNLHLISATEIVSKSYPEVIGEERISTNDDMVHKFIVWVIEVDERVMDAQRHVHEPL